MIEGMSAFDEAALKQSLISMAVLGTDRPADASTILVSAAIDVLSRDFDHGAIVRMLRHAINKVVADWLAIDNGPKPAA